PEVESVCDRVQSLHHGATVFNDSIAALKQFQGGRMMLLGLKRPPPHAEIASVDGVARVEAADGLLRVAFAEGADPTDELVRRAVEKSWGLYQLTPAQASLEDVFCSLTRKEEQA
ncbi:MAG: ABC transporter ATP-binding protein, partial [Proteobacteria bacterium]|nr:ABC transporter ATP-binding protein [Pseudomonadota bacterium]